MIRSKKRSCSGGCQDPDVGGINKRLFHKDIVPPDSHTGKKKSQKITENISFFGTIKNINFIDT